MTSFEGARGRLFLWSLALIQCQQLLKLADRANEEIDSGRALAKTMRDEPKRRAYIESLPDYTPSGPLKFSHIQAARNAYPEDFGHVGDCHSISDACRMLAIVFFCQPFNGGNSGDGVATNDRQFREQHLPPVLAVAFPAESDRSSFLELLEQLKAARDKVVAHGDASFFQYADNGSISTMRLPQQVLKSIDFKRLANLLEPFIQAIDGAALLAPLVEGGVGNP